jgi:hypothetical protein
MCLTLKIISEDKIDGKYFENMADFRYFGKKKQIQTVCLKKLTADYVREMSVTNRNRIFGFSVFYLKA